MSNFFHKVQISPHCIQGLLGLGSFKREDDVFIVRILLRCFGGEELSINPGFVVIGHVVRQSLQSLSFRPKKGCLYDGKHLYRHLSGGCVVVKSTRDKYCGRDTHGEVADSVPKSLRKSLCLLGRLSGSFFQQL